MVNLIDIVGKRVSVNNGRVGILNTDGICFFVGRTQENPFVENEVEVWHCTYPFGEGIVYKIYTKEYVAKEWAKSI